MAISLIKTADNRFLIKNKFSYFYVNEVTYFIIEKHILNYNYDEIGVLLNKNYHSIDFNEELVKKIIEDTRIQNILKEKTDKNDIVSKTQYIYFKRKILNPENIVKLLKFLNYLFNKKVSVSIITISIVLTSVIFIHYDEKIMHIQSSIGKNFMENIYTLIAIYIFFIITIFFHELGHATASYRCGVTPKEIGFGFYYAMPVLYTELTDVWILDKNKRVIINLSGIYFQMIINILLGISLLLFPTNQPIFILFSINTLSMVYALNPFFKNDGYWVFSDYFEIRNLELKSDICFKHFLRFLFIPKKSMNVLKNKGKVLILYSFLSLLFWFYFMFRTSKHMIINVHKNYSELISNFNIWVVLKAVFFLFFLYMFVKSFYNRIKNVFNEKF